MTRTIFLLVLFCFLAACAGPGAPRAVTLQVVVEGEGGVSSEPGGVLDCRDDCSAEFAAGARVTLRAAPDAGHGLLVWSEAECGTAPTCELQLGADRTVTVRFALLPTLSGLADQALIQNTGGPRTLELPFTAAGAEEAATAVSATSSDPALTGTPTVNCDASGACTLTLEVARAVPGSATVTLTARDPDGLEAEASFSVVVGPRLITSAADAGAGTLRGALAEAQAGDVLAFDRAGVFAGAQTVTLSSGQLVLGKSLAVAGPGRDLLTLQAGGGQRHFYVLSGSSVALSGMTLSGGNAQDGGGSVLVNAAGGAVANRGELTLSGVRLTGNRAVHGGALYNAAGGALTVVDALLDANESQSGGAIFNDSQAPAAQVRPTSLTLQNVELRGNVAANYGGALYNYESGTAVSIADSRFLDNRAQSSSAINNGRLQCGPYPKSDPRYEDSCVTHAGSLTISGTLLRGNVSEERTIGDGNGALSNFGVLSVTDSAFEANVAPSGAGLYNQFRARATLTGVTFSDNRAALNGGGIYNEGELSFVGVTVSGNRALNNGAGIFHNSFVGTLSLPTGNSVTGNEAGNQGGGIYNEGYALAPGSVASGVVSGNVPGDVADERRPRSTAPVLHQAHRGRRL